MRAEIFCEEVLANCQYTSTVIKHMVRGMGPILTPFTYGAWNPTEPTSYVSQVAGTERVPDIDFKTVNVNITRNGQPPPSLLT
jgi:hypothetical protein